MCWIWLCLLLIAIIEKNIVLFWFVSFTENGVSPTENGESKIAPKVSYKTLVLC